MSALARQRHAALRRVALWLGSLYLVALALIALWPTPVDRIANRHIVRILIKLHDHGVPNWFSYALIEFSANIVLFLPVGMLGVILLRSARWWVAILIGFGASCLIELSQLVFLPSRYATPMDVLANTLGAAVGAVLALIVLATITARSNTSSQPAAGSN